MARETDLATLENDRVRVVQPDALAIIQRTELETAMEYAHRYPRSIQAFQDRARTIACRNPEIAGLCGYTLPGRDEKGNPIAGPSARLAEIVAVTYGNATFGVRIVDVGDEFITVMGVGRDLETNTSVAVEVVRSITYSAVSGGGRFTANMIQTTAMAATSIAFRNTVFKIVPAVLIDELYQDTIKVALEEAQGIEKRREAAVAYFFTRGISYARIFNALGVKSFGDIGWEHIQQLIGFTTSVQTEGATLNSIFPEIEGSVPMGKGIGFGTQPKPKEEEGAGAGKQPAANGGGQAGKQPAEEPKKKEPTRTPARRKPAPGVDSGI